MRADRLLALLMLLQGRGRMTAEALAAELEVSVRTVYRDMDALSGAGVPVYAERGPGGGCSLVDGYRTSLTGLTELEVRALFMLALPAALAQLGLSREAKAALAKLSASLPFQRRRDETWVKQRVHLDWSWWHEAEEPVPHLRTLQRAVFEDRKLLLTYWLQLGPWRRTFRREVDPYGLVGKAGVWHLVCAGQGRIRVYRVSRVARARLLDQPFQRPAHFDLGRFWREWCQRQEANRQRTSVTLRVSQELVPELPRHFGEAVRQRLSAATPPDREGKLTLTLAFESLRAARERLLGFGGAVEVLEPEPLRKSMADFAARIVALYGPTTGSEPRSRPASPPLRRARGAS